MKILIIEDERELSRAMESYFTSHDVHCEFAFDTSTALEKLEMHEYDCVVLDLMLPDGSGMEILKHIKSSSKEEGVIIISAKDGLDQKLEGFSTGADDYLTKPFHLSELTARVLALIRRKKFSGMSLIHSGEITVDTNAKKVKVGEMEIEMTKKEFELLLYLISNKNKVLSKSAIAEHLSGDLADMLDNHDFVYAHIKNLKSKLKSVNCTDYIKTVYGLGYKWQID
jgi:DNA-binding response OmpR family regulator